MVRRFLTNAGPAGEFVDDDDSGGDAAALVAAHSALRLGVHGIVGRGVFNGAADNWISHDAGFTNVVASGGPGDWTINLASAMPWVYLLCFAVDGPNLVYQNGAPAGAAYNIKMVDLAGAPADRTWFVIAFEGP